MTQKYNELTQNLLKNPKVNKNPEERIKNRTSMSLVHPQLNHNFHVRKSFDFIEEEDHHLISSQLIAPHTYSEWNEEQINQRSLIMGDNEYVQKSLVELIEYSDKIAGIKEESTKGFDQAEYRLTSEIKYRNTTQIITASKKDLNYRIFHLSKNLLTFLYYFNLFFNIIFRISLVAILAFLILEEKNFTLMSVIVGLQLVVLLLYLIAMHKMLYTKSSDISVHFQKTFYLKPYAEIHMDRIMRKHFTFHNMCKNFTKFLNPTTRFRKDIKISVMRQQIFKRMEIILVFIPLVLTFVVSIHWFDFEQINSEALIGVLFCVQTVRIFLHYLIIYIFS